ncbi:MAG: flagellar basal body L-ring protein FlgH [Candidatus Lambdaproteobacteria bacterium]|nr:flagellar basal body L-ring protein FlgH [Candidatus Lambdaproteobacteria bacterium]
MKITVPQTARPHRSRAAARALALLPALGALLLVLGSEGCAVLGDPQPAAAQQRVAAAELPARDRYKTRPPINTTDNRYEGSLWLGAASWGNLLRDHRARYTGDLLTVTEMGKIIKVPEAVVEKPQAEQVAKEEDGKKKTAVDPVLAFLREQQQAREAIEREQNDILRSIDSMEVQVVKVLSNGNMFVQGVHPPIFRDQNRVKYIVTLRGVVQPSDVDNNNQIASSKLSRAEYKIRRLVKRTTLPVGAIARAAGRPEEGNLADRFTDFLTSPGTGNRTTAVSSK